MNERDFKALLRKKIKPHAYIQSMSSYATNGTPDLWISGVNKDLWLEAKVESPDKRNIKPKLTKLQAKWIKERTLEGRDVWTIVGLSTKEAILYRGLACFDTSNNRQSIDEIIKIILDEYLL